MTSRFRDQPAHRRSGAKYYNHGFAITGLHQCCSPVDRFFPDVILAHSTPVATALQRESHEIPIVFVNVSDPIGSGLIANLARPGGNITGVLFYEESIIGKWLAMLKEIAPQLTRAALVANPKTTAYDYFVRLAKAIAPSLAIELVPNPVETAADIERTIVDFARVPNGGLVLPPDNTTIIHRELIIACSPPPIADDLLGQFSCRSRGSDVLRC